MVFYQIFIPSYADSNADGIGDIRGIIEKFDELLQLNIDGIWLSPIHKSPSYHKYDIVDYYSIDENYGTEIDLRELLDLAHFHGIKVLMDLVINHTSIEHPWFVESQNAESDKHDYYIWRSKDEIESVEKENLQADSDNRVQWHEVEGVNKDYFAYFYWGMPELNYDNYFVRQEVKNIAKYWLEFGFDGFRIDAAKHIYEHTGEIDKCARWWEEFNEIVKQVKPDALLFGEIWDSITFQAQFCNGFDGMFNFEFSGILLDCLKKNDGKRFANEMLRIQKELSRNQMKLTSFLSNHDQNRVRSVLKSDQKAMIAAYILCLFEGYRFIYQGEELGQRGEKPDEHIREAYPWGDRFTANWVKPIYHRLTPDLKKQKDQSSSMLNFYKARKEMNFGEFEIVQLPFVEIFAIRNQTYVLLINFSAREFDLRRYRLGTLRSFEISLTQIRNS